MDSKGFVQTIIGKSRTKGYKDGNGLNVLFNSPTGICFGKTKNILFITDTDNHVIRKVNIQQSYQTTTIGVYQSSSPQVSDGISTKSLFRSPFDIINYQNQSLIVCETFGNIREVNLDSEIVTTIHLPFQLHN